MSLYESFRSAANQSSNLPERFQALSGNGAGPNPELGSAAQRLGLGNGFRSDINDKFRIAAHEGAGHFATNLQNGVVPTGYFVGGAKTGGVTMTAVSRDETGFAQRMTSLVSGAAAESLLTGSNTPVRDIGHRSDILNFSSLVDPNVKSPGDLTPSHVNDFYRVVQARMTELAPHRESLLNLANAMVDNPAWASPKMGDTYLDRINSMYSASVQKSAMPGPVRDASIEWLRASSGEEAANNFANMVAGIDYAAPGLMQRPVGRFDASQIGNPLQAFRQALAPKLDTYTPAANLGNATVGTLNNATSQVWGKTGVDISGGVRPQAGGVQVGNLPGSNVKYAFRSGITTTDANGANTMWKVQMIGQGASVHAQNAWLHAELQANLAAQTGQQLNAFGVMTFDRDKYDAARQAGVSHEDALSQAFDRASSQAFNPGQVSTSLNSADQNLANLADASQQAFGLSGQNFAMQIDPGASPQEMLGHLDQGLGRLGAAFADDTQAAAAMPGITKAALSGGVSGPLRGGLYLNFGNNAANALNAMNAPGGAGGAGAAGPLAPGGAAAGGAAGGIGGRGGAGGAGAATPAAGPGGGGSGSGGGNANRGGKSYGSIDPKDYAAHIEALSHSLERLSKISQDATGTTARLGDEQQNYIKRSEDLFQTLNQAVSVASRQADPQSAAFVRSVNAAGFDRVGDLLGGGPQGQGLLDRAFVDSYRDRPASNRPSGLNERLAPFTLSGQSRRDAMQRADEGGWYGDSSVERAAWGVLGTAASLPGHLLQARYRIRGIEQEFLNPMSQARDAYLQSQQGRMGNLMSTDAYGGIGLVGSEAFNSAFMPSTLAYNRQLAYGEATNRAVGGALNAATGLLGQTNAANAMALGSMTLAGGAIGTELGGPAGALIGSTLGAAGWVVGQANAYATDRQLQRRTIGNIADKGVQGAMRDDAGGVLGFGLNIASARLFGDAYAETRLNNKVVSDIASNSRVNAMLAGKADPNSITSEDLLSFNDKYLKQSAVGKDIMNDDQRYAAFTQAFSTVGKQGSQAPGGRARLDQRFGAIVSYTASGIDAMGDTAALMSARGLNPYDREGGAFGQTLDNLGQFLSGPDAMLRERMLQPESQKAGAIRAERVRAGLGGDVAATSTELREMSLTWAGRLPTAAAREKAQRGIMQGDEYSGVTSSISMTSELADQGGYTNYLSGLSADSSVAGSRLWHLQSDKALSVDKPLFQQLTKGYGESDGIASARVTNMARTLSGYTADATQYAEQGALRGLGSANLKGLAQIRAAGMSGEFESRLQSVASGENLRYGSSEYQARASQLLTEWQNKPDSASYIRGVGEDRDWASYNQAARVGGMGTLARGSFAGMTDQQRQLTLEAQTAVINVRSVTGNAGETGAYRQITSDIAGAKTDADYFRANQRIGQLGQANSFLERNAAYQSQSQLAGLQSTLGGAAYNLQGPQFQQFMGIASGDPIANSIAADQGLVSNRRRLIQTGKYGGSIGMQAGYDESITGDVAADRQALSQKWNMIPGGSQYSAGQLSGMSVMQLQAAQRKEEVGIRNYDFNLQWTQLNRQQNATITGWGFEDRGIALSRTEQDYGFGYQQKQLDLQKQQMTAGFAYQQQSMTMQRSHQVQEQQWGLQDIDYSRNLSAMQFGFSQIDADESIRYSTGRARRDAMRHRDEAVATHGMEMGHLDTEEERAKTRMKWSTDQFELDKRHFEQDKQFAIQGFNLTQENHNKQVEFSKQERLLDDERRAFTRKVASEEMAEARESLAVHQASKKAMDDLAGAINTANTYYNQNAAALSNAAVAAGAFDQWLATLASQMAAMAAAPMPRAPGDTAPPPPGGSSGDPTAGPHAGLRSSPIDGQTVTAGNPGGAPQQGYASGGFTGRGNPSEPAGRVHKGEYVIPHEGAPILIAPEHIAVLKDILSELRGIHADGGNAVINVHQSNPMKTTQKRLFDMAYSQ